MTQIKASELDFTNQLFSPSEWPEDSLDWLDMTVIAALFEIRNVLPISHSIIPSPIYGAHVRHDMSTSRHSTHNRTKLSCATDVFMKWEHVWSAITLVQNHPHIGGLGIYTDNMLKGVRGDYAMLHLDTRPKENFRQWVGWRYPNETNLRYTYYNSDPKGFFELLVTRGKYA